MAVTKKTLEVSYISKRTCIIDFGGNEADFKQFVKKHWEDPEIEFDTHDGQTLTISPVDIPDLLRHYDLLLVRSE